jgi:hypothetical protein
MIALSSSLQALRRSRPRTEASGAFGRRVMLPMAWFIELNTTTSQPQFIGVALADSDQVAASHNKVGT